MRKLLFCKKWDAINSDENAYIQSDAANVGEIVGHIGGNIHHHIVVEKALWHLMTPLEHLVILKAAQVQRVCGLVEAAFEDLLKK